MRIRLKRLILVYGKEMKKGEIFEINDRLGQALIAKEYADLEKEAKPIEAPQDMKMKIKDVKKGSRKKGGK